MRMMIDDNDLLYYQVCIFPYLFLSIDTTGFILAWGTRQVGEREAGLISGRAGREEEMIEFIDY